MDKEHSVEALKHPPERQITCTNVDRLLWLSYTAWTNFYCADFIHSQHGVLEGMALLILFIHDIVSPAKPNFPFCTLLAKGMSPGNIVNQYLCYSLKLVCASTISVEWVLITWNSRSALTLVMVRPHICPGAWTPVFFTSTSSVCVCAVCIPFSSVHPCCLLWSPSSKGSSFLEKSLWWSIQKLTAPTGNFSCVGEFCAHSVCHLYTAVLVVSCCVPFDFDFASF